MLDAYLRLLFYSSQSRDVFVQVSRPIAPSHARLKEKPQVMLYTFMLWLQAPYSLITPNMLWCCFTRTGLASLLYIGGALKTPI